jgi:hypothetical protein
LSPTPMARVPCRGPFFCRVAMMVTATG